MQKSFALGVDVGGSHITTGIVDLDQKTLLSPSIRRKKISAHEGVSYIISAWSETMRESILSSGLTQVRIGMALPGPFDYEKGISYIRGLDKYDALYGQPVKALLAEALGISETDIQMKNDAGCFLQGEIFSGAASGETKCIGLTIGTGIGTAKTVNGIGEDADRWHTPFRESIAENYLSTRWFVARYRELFGKEVRDVKSLCEQMKEEPGIQAIFDEFAENLSTFLVTFIGEEQPNLIILGGNITHADQYFLPVVIQNLQKKNIHIPIRKSILGEHAALIGSAGLWSREPNFNHA